jgi:hypothetical protein
VTYSPILPSSGYAGWTMLKRTMAKQTETFAKSPEIVRDEDYFRANIGKIKTAEDLVKDRRLLKVALGAFGLDADLSNKAFIQKVMSDDTSSATALANKLSDKQYLKLAVAFGFGSGTPKTATTGFADTIITAYRTRGFETAVGDQDGDLRLALNAQREVTALAGGTSSDTVKWYTILGNTAMKQVFTKALGLPSSISSADLDAQLAAFQDGAEKLFGESTVSQFSDPTKMEGLVRRFLVRSEADTFANTNGSASRALAMLQQTASFMRQNR